MTSGHVNVTPSIVGSPVDLLALCEYLADQPYGSPPAAGWGGIVTSTNGVESQAFVRDNPGTPLLTDIRGGQILKARLLIDQFNPRKARDFPEEMRGDIPASYTHDLDATDVLLYLNNDQTVVLIGTHDGPSLARTTPHIESALDAIAASHGRLTSYPHTDPDLILWLIYRLGANPSLSQELQLLDVRFVRSSNTNNQRCDIRDSIGTERAELLALIGQTGVIFGTVKLKVLHRSLDLELDLLLNVDGSFSPYVGTSFYREDPALKSGVRLALDTARTAIPDLQSAHSADSAWPAQRTQFRSDARSGISQLLV